MDLSSLAQNLPQIAQQLLPLAGAFAGGHGSPGSTAGALAALGDVQHEKNQRNYESVKTFADQLEKIGMDTENWSEEARNAAMQERFNLLSPKTLSKIYSNPNAADQVMSRAWDSIRQASARPEPNQQTERNTAAGKIPYLQGTQQSAPGLGGAGMGGLGGLAASAAGAQERTAQTIANTPQRTVMGPLTPGEKAQRSYAAIKPFINGGGGGGAASGGSGAAGGGVGVPGMTMVPRIGANGKMQFGPMMPSFTTEYQHYRRSDGSEGSGTVWVDHRTRQAYIDTENGQQPVQLLEKLSRTGLTKYETVDDNGQKVMRFGTPAELIGKSIAAAVPTRMIQSTGPNGERYTYDIRPGFNGAPNSIVAKHQTGVVPFAALKGEMLSLGLAGKQLSNAIAEYKINGSMTLPDGTRYIPNGTLLDQNNQPITPIAGPAARPSTRQSFKVDVATSLAQTIDETRDVAKRLESRYGPITGKISDWAADHGIDLSSDSAEARDVGRLVMNVTSIGGLSTSAHSFMSGDFAKDIDSTVGRMGQDFQLGMGKLDALYDFANRVRVNSAYSPLPTQKNTPGTAFAPRKPQTAKPKAGAPGNPTIKPAAAPPNSNMETLRQIQQLLAGGR